MPVRGVALHRGACDIGDLAPPVYRIKCMSWECTLCRQCHSVRRMYLDPSKCKHSWMAIRWYCCLILSCAPPSKITYSTQAARMFWIYTNRRFNYTFLSRSFSIPYLSDDPKRAQYSHALIISFDVWCTRWCYWTVSVIWVVAWFIPLFFVGNGPFPFMLCSSSTDNWALWSNFNKDDRSSCISPSE